MTSSRAINYARAATEEICDFIERSTRFVPKDLRFDKPEQLDVFFRVDVLHQIECSLIVNTTKGRTGSSAEDLVAESRNEFWSLAESLRTEASCQFDVIRDLAKEVAEEHYGVFVDDTDYGLYYRSVVFTYQCQTCTGTGNVSCDSCGGRGKHTCHSCGGMGSTMETHWETDHRGHSTTTTRSETCSWCMGSGDTSCPHCGGGGEVTCGTCSGYGQLTDTAQSAYEVKSRYSIGEVSTSDNDVEYALNVRVQLHRISESLARIDRRHVEVRETARQIFELVEFTCPFFKSNVAVNGISAKMVVFGESCAVSDAGGLIENLVRPDLAYLQQAVARLRWFDFPALLYAQKICRLFMESEVHQIAIEDTHTLGKCPDDFRDLADKLAKSLSPEYLCNAITTIERLTEQINGETQRVVWLFMLPVMAAVATYFVSLDAYFMATASILGIGLLTRVVSQLLITIQLRRTGARRLEDFSARHHAHRPGILGLP